MAPHGSALLEGVRCKVRATKPSQRNLEIQNTYKIRVPTYVILAHRAPLMSGSITATSYSPSLLHGLGRPIFTLVPSQVLYAVTKHSLNIRT